MSFPLDQIEFKRNAVEPIECIKAGLELVKSNYWLFVGMVFLVTISGIVPFGLVMGPLMCGLYLALFRARRGEPIEFGTLFKGFDYFGDAVIAALLHMIPMFAIIIPAYILFYLGMFAMMATSRIGEPDPGAMLGFFGVFAVVWLVIIIVLIVISVVFTFAYPLIVDRHLSGLNAVKLSIRAGWANFWRLFGLLLLSGLMVFVGALFCYVGAFFVAPIMYGAIATAYEQVFGLSDLQPNVPPPPPSFV
jgi:uncharacterized membrane protein